MKDREYKRLLRKSLEDNLQYNKKYEEVLGYCGLSSDDPLTKKLINKKKYKFRKLIVTLACLCTLLAVSTCVFMFGFFEEEKKNNECIDNNDNNTLLTEEEIKYIESYGCDISTLSKVDYDMNDYYCFSIYSFISKNSNYYFLKLNKKRSCELFFEMDDKEYETGLAYIFFSNKYNYSKNKITINVRLDGEDFEYILYV